jgi:hypothetical protein
MSRKIGALPNIHGTVGQMYTDFETKKVLLNSATKEEITIPDWAASCRIVSDSDFYLYRTDEGDQYKTKGISIPLIGNKSGLFYLLGSSDSQDAYIIFYKTLPTGDKWRQ